MNHLRMKDDWESSKSHESNSFAVCLQWMSRGDKNIRYESNENIL